MQHDDDDIGLGPRQLHRRQGAQRVAQHGQPGSGIRRFPALPKLVDVAQGDDRYPGSADLGDPGLVGLRGRAAAQGRDPVAARVVQRVGEPDLAVVKGVIVGDGHRIDPCRFNRGVRRSGARKRNSLGSGIPRSVTAVLRLTKARSARESTGAIRPKAVCGSSSRASVRSEKWTSPPKASVMSRGVAEGEGRAGGVGRRSGHRGASRQKYDDQ